jgi:hypothetical protein
LGSIPIVANDYTVHVGITSTSVITIEWASNDNPAPATPLNVNGASQSTGVFLVSLSYPSGTFPSTALPTSLATTGFNTAPVDNFQPGDKRPA